MNAASFFSGVGGLDLGLERAGMRVVSQCEADPWRRRVLAARFPGVPITDDVRANDVRLAGKRVSGQVVEGQVENVDSRQAGNRQGARAYKDPGGHDLVVGGVPCQDWSVAGKRAGIRGARSGLFFDWCDRIADELDRGGARWILFENVPGLLSAADGRDFGIVLATLADLGYGLAWRVLDARFFGVPQRRRRVFIVGHLGSDGGPAVRALGAGGEGDLAAGECSWQGAAAGAGGGAAGDGRVSAAVTSKWRKGTGGPAGDECQNLMAFRPTGGSLGVEAGPLSPALKVGSGVGIPSPPAVLSVAQNQRAAARRELHRDIGLAKLAGGKPGEGYPAMRAGSTVRRLTPVECERLMSWPDGWTAIDGPDTPDGRRYAACGDGVVSNVSEWIARRILVVDGMVAA